MRNIKRHFVTVAFLGTLLSAFIAGCGREQPPTPPEKVNPAQGRPAPMDPATSNATVNRDVK